MNGKIGKLVFCLFLLIPCSGFTQRVMTLSELMTDMQNRREHYIDSMTILIEDLWKSIWKYSPSQTRELVRDADFLFIPSMDIKKEDSVERDYTRLDQLLSSLEFQNDFFPVYNILLFKNDRYFSSYFDSGIRIIGTRIPIRPYPIPITPELKREAELIWSLKPVMCFDINVFPGSILWIKTEDNRWLVVNQETEQVSDAQTYLDSLDADKLKKEIEQKNAIPIQNRYLWDYCKIGPDGKVIEWTKRFYWR